MKRVVNLVPLICVFLLSTTVMASDLLSVKVENSSTINVVLSNTFKGQRLTIKDYAGVTLYNVKLSKKSLYSKFFDFEKAENGIYFVETETKFDIQITPVIKTENGVSLVEQAVETIFKPGVVVDGDYIKLLYTRSKESPLTIAIYDDNGTLLFDEEVDEGTSIIKRTYNISQLPNGSYDVDFNTSDRVFTEKVKI